MSLAELWIPVTLAAAGFQAARTAVQRWLAGRLSVNGATFTRFLFGLPFSAAYLAIVVRVGGFDAPPFTPAFFGWVALGGLAQIGATALLLVALTGRSFPVGTAYSKTEAIQAALFGAVVLHEGVSPLAAGAIAIATAGVMIFTARGAGLRGLVAGFADRAAWAGIVAGSLFAVAAIGFRGAALSLQQDSAVFAAACTLVAANLLQTTVMAIYLAVRERDQFAKIAQSWRPSLAAGFTAAGGSACWFLAMTLQTVALVRTLGLIELLFIFAISILIFREKVRAAEVAGIALLLAGLAILLNAH